MSTRSKPCPMCGAQLDRGHRNDLSTWECPAGHGVGVFLIDAWGKLQRDELEALWENAKTAPRSHLKSPISGEPMLEVTFGIDQDMRVVDDTQDIDMTIEVDETNYFGWFQIEELSAMPRDAQRRGPQAPGMVGLDQMDDHHDQTGHVFTDLEPEDLVERTKSDRGFFSGLADRLRQSR